MKVSTIKMSNTLFCYNNFIEYGDKFLKCFIIGRVYGILLKLLQNSVTFIIYKHKKLGDVFSVVLVVILNKY